MDVERVGVCGTDVEFFTGQMAHLHQGHSSYPMRLGHEWCGTVAAAGDGVDPAWVGRRDLGGALFATAGAWCARQWYRTSGPTAAAGLSALYVAAMGGSHPLAKRIGAWPSVITVTAITVTAAELVTRTAAR